MKKIFPFLSKLALASVMVMVVTTLMGWKRVPDLVAKELSDKLKVNVSIGGISGSKDAISITKIEIDNPTGSTLGQAFTCGTMALQTPVANYLKQDVIIDEITLDDVYFDLEFEKPRSKEGNWSSIMNNVMQEQKGVAKDQKNHTVLIRKLILTNVKTDLVYRKQNDQGKHLPVIDRIELNDLYSEGGAVTGQIVKLVLGQSIKAVFEKQDLKHPLPGGHLRYLLPLRRMSSQ